MGLYLRGPKGPILKVTSPAQVVVPSPHHPPATAPDPPPWPNNYEALVTDGCVCICL